MDEFSNLIKSLNYEVESLTKLYKNNDYCFSAWIYSNGKYVLSSMNNTFKNLFGITDKKREHVINNFYDIKCLRESNMIRYLKSQKQIVSVYHTVDKNTLWKVYVECIEDRIHVMGCRISEELGMVKYCLLEHKMLGYDFYYDFEITKDNKFKINNYDNVFASTFKIEKKIPIINERQICSLKFDDLFFKSIATNQNLIINILMDINNVHIYTIQEIIVNMENTLNKMTALVNVVNKKEYDYFSEIIYKNYDNIVNNKDIGYGHVGFVDTMLQFTFENETLLSLFNKNPLLSEQILKSESIMKALHYVHNQKEKVTLINLENKRQEFEIRIIPAIYNDKVESIILYVEPLSAVLYEQKLELIKLLTNREKEVLLLASCGVTNRSIAFQLGIREGTVKRLIYNGFQKLNICSRLELIPFQNYLKTYFIKNITIDINKDNNNKDFQS